MSYPTATNSGQRIMVNGSASSPIPKTAPPRENSTKSTGISSFSAPFALRISPIRPASIAPVRIIIPNAPPTIIRNAMISIAELFTIPLYMKLKNPVPPSPLKSATPSVTTFPASSLRYWKLPSLITVRVFSTPFIIYVTSCVS